MVSWLLCAAVLADGAQPADDGQLERDRGTAAGPAAVAPVLDQVDKPGKPKVRQPSDLKKQPRKPPKTARQSDTITFGGGQRFTFAIPVKGSGEVELNVSWTPEVVGTVTVSAPGEDKAIADKKGRGKVSLSIPVEPRNVGSEWRVHVHVPQGGRGVTGELTVAWPGEADGRLAWTNSCLADKKERDYLRRKIGSIRHVLAGNEPRTAEEEWLAGRLQQNPDLDEALQDLVTASEARLEARELIPASRLRKTDARLSTPVFAQADQLVTQPDVEVPPGTYIHTIFKKLECSADFHPLERPFVLAGFVREDGSYRTGGYTETFDDLQPGDQRPLAWANDELFAAHTRERSYLQIALFQEPFDIAKSVLLDQFLLFMDDPTQSLNGTLTGLLLLGLSETLTLVPDGIYTEQGEMLPWNTEGEHGEGYMYTIRFEDVGLHHRGALFGPQPRDADFTIYVRIGPD